LLLTVGSAPAPAPSGGLFGSSPAPAFGAAPSSSGFGFGAPAPSPGLFSAPSVPQTPQPAAPQPYVMPPAGAIIPPAANELLAQQLSALEKQTKELEKSDVWKQSSTPKAVITASSNADDSWNALNPSPASYSSFQRTPFKSSTKIRPRGFGLLSPENGTSSVGKLGSGVRPIMTPDSIASSQVKRLVINPSPRMKLKQLTVKPSQETNSGVPTISAFAASPSPPATNGSGGGASFASKLSPTPSKGPTVSSPSNYYNQVVGSPDQATTSSHVKMGNAPSLTKPGYFTTPSIDVLETLSGEDLAAVENFSIEHEKYGRIEWEGAVDVRGADLDHIVEIDQSVASLYEKDEEENRKPAVGSKLNRQAIITLYSVFPKKGPAASDEAKEAFAQKVKKSTKKMGAQFLCYDKTSGEWKMRVQHFSKYGLLDDDADSNDGVVSDELKFQSRENGGEPRPF
jgi:nuclear pore complex protein Nup98-Nup96